MKTDFDKTQPAPDCSVNYVWLCARVDGNDLAKYATRLPLHNFERIYNNTAKYPNAQFNLWLDFEQLALQDRFFLNTHQYIFDAHHLNLRNLRDLDGYKNNAGFDADTNHALYARADYARILVLDHILKTKPDVTGIYSDVDCEDVKLDDMDMNNALYLYGLSYGCTGGHQMSNNYIAVQGDKGKDFLTNYLLPRTTAAFEKILVNHFGAFSNAVRSYRDDNHFSFRCNDLGIVRLPPMRTAMPYDEGTYGRVCAATPTRIPGSIDLI